jgi:hypothetical protein
MPASSIGVFQNQPPTRLKQTRGASHLFGNTTNGAKLKSQVNEVKAGLLKLCGKEIILQERHIGEARFSAK